MWKYSDSIRWWRLSSLLLLSPYFWCDHRQVANFHFTLIFKRPDFFRQAVSTKVWRWRLCSSGMFATQKDWQYCSNHFKFGMFAQAEYHVCEHKEAQHVASLSTVTQAGQLDLLGFFYKTDACSWTTLPCYWLRFKHVFFGCMSSLTTTHKLLPVAMNDFWFSRTVLKLYFNIALQNQKQFFFGSLFI